MERLDVPVVLREAAVERHRSRPRRRDLLRRARHHIIPREDGQGMPRWLEAIYAAMERNASHVGDVLRLPPEATVELGAPGRNLTAPSRSKPLPLIRM